MKKQSKNLTDERNFLDFIPVIHHNCVSRTDDDTNYIIIDIAHTGFYDKIAQKFFKRPKQSHIALDEMGSFIFSNIDGINTVYDLSVLIKKEFGEDAEPILERLIMYIKILKNNNFIEFRKKG